MCSRRVVFLIICTVILFSATAKKKKYRSKVVHYPKGSLFWATDFFVRGCKVFLEKCPEVYKVQHICAMDYNGVPKDFYNYCEMQYENCNSWRNWRVYKREWC